MDSYSATLDYLFSKFPMYQNIGETAYKADLGPIKELLHQLEHPEEKFKSIHVGGTNGKGSVSHMLSAALQENGLKVGLYTSPHLLDFRERIKIDGKEISKEEVIEFVETHRTSFETLSPSFFEWSVALAFHHFAKNKVDVAIVEVGMGGRLDATNVIKPVLSVITNIGLDHQKFLGDTHEKIAFEKAGIIKSNTSVVIGEYRHDTLPVFTKVVEERNATIIHTNSEHGLSTDLKGSYQKQNLNTVSATLQALENTFNLDSELNRRGLQNVVELTGLKGRWQKVSESPLIILDVGHNKEGLSFNMKQLQEEEQGDVFVMLGFVNDKNIDGLMDLFPQDYTYITCQANNRRAKDKKSLGVLFNNNGLKTLEIEGDISSQIPEILSHINDSDTLYIGGSTFVVAEALEFFK